MKTPPERLGDLKFRVESMYPAVRLVIDEPLDPDGQWWIDLVFGAQRTDFSFRPKLGFEFYRDQDCTFGAKPDRTLVSVEDAVFQVVEMLNAWGISPVADRESARAFASR